MVQRGVSGKERASRGKEKLQRPRVPCGGRGGSHGGVSQCLASRHASTIDLRDRTGNVPGVTEGCAVQGRARERNQRCVLWRRSS